MKIRGLLLKDIFELWAQCRVQLVLTGVYLLLPLFIKGIGLFASVGMMLLAMMPIYALGYDERCRWERYALAMPVRKSDLFWSRFLLGVIAIALGAAVQTLAALLAGRGELLSSLAVTAPSAVVYLLITLPLIMDLNQCLGKPFRCSLGYRYAAGNLLFLSLCHTFPPPLNHMTACLYPFPALCIISSVVKLFLYAIFLTHIC